jgi:phosphoadenosine phosphosulfate reductase
MDPKSVNLDALARMDAPELLGWARDAAGRRAAIGTSLQKSGVVMIDLASRLDGDLRVFWIETLLDYPETYALYHRLCSRYEIEIERFAPAAEDIEQLRRKLGQWEHFMDRRSCCFVRKTLPLHRAQHTLDIWISGLRADQSRHRQEQAAKAEWVRAGDGRQILKLNPLRDWDLDRVDAYIDDNDVPINELYGYVSDYGERFSVISCQRCHIPVKADMDPRAGKWPWENEGPKECGLHIGGDGI